MTANTPPAAGDGPQQPPQQTQQAPAAPRPPPAPPTLAHLKEALRVLETTHQLFTSMKAKVVYTCGLAHMLTQDEGRQYLSKVIKTLDDDQRSIRSSWPRLQQAFEVARACNRMSAARSTAAAAAGTSAAAGGGGAAGGVGSGAAPSAAAVAAQRARDQSRALLQQLDSALNQQLLPVFERPAKRQRTEPPAAAPGQAAGAGAGAAAGGAAGAAAGACATAASRPPAPAPVQPTLELLGVLHRVRALELTSPAPGVVAGGQGGAGPGAGGAAIKVLPLDDGGNVLHLPSAFVAAVGAAGGPGPDDALVRAAAARLLPATQVRLLVPGVFVANVVLRGAGCSEPLRVAADCVERAFDMDPWATPNTQVFRRLSSLATRVLAYYVKRAPLSVVPPPTPAAAGQQHPSNPSDAGAHPSVASPPAPGAGAATSPPQPTAASPPAAAPTPPPAQPSAAANGQHPGASHTLWAAVTQGPGSPGAAALEELLLWLATCRDLFSKRCAATGKLLALDPSVQHPIPPIFRAFKYPRDELRLRAQDPSRVSAYHMHAAPVEQLGWPDDVAGGLQLGGALGQDGVALQGGQAQGAAGR